MSAFSDSKRHLIYHWFKNKIKNNNNSRQTKDTVNYCVLINKLLELMGDERIQLEKNIQLYGGRTISPS